MEASSRPDALEVCSLSAGAVGGKMGINLTKRHKIRCLTYMFIIMIMEV